MSHIRTTARSFYAARHEPENMRPLAEWYWRTLLMLSLVAVIVILIFSTWRFIAVLRALSAGDPQATSRAPEILNKKELGELLNAYNARAEGFESAKRTVTSISDPSR